MQAGFLWFDFETFGANARSDRPCQFAAIRTDEQLNIVGEPIEMFCQPILDYVPHPMAVEITGISPLEAQSKGLSEYEFAKTLHQLLALPQTCMVGYNSIRFDDEVIRHLFYRNLLDPYEREYKNGNSRWDLLDVMRLAYALRPDGLNWPTKDDGLPDFRLEALVAANDIAVGHAHDAVNDVYATIYLAQKLRLAQPKLWDWAFGLRNKHRVLELLQVGAGQPLLHVSGMFSAAQGCLSIVLPLFVHPHNNNEIVCVDLQQDTTQWLDQTADEVRTWLYTPKAELGEQIRPALKSIHINKSPMIAPLSLLTTVQSQRLGLDVAQMQQHFAQAQGRFNELVAFFTEVVGIKREFDPLDVELAIYQGFVSPSDRKVCLRVHQSAPSQWAKLEMAFVDSRLTQLLFRLRARFFAETLTSSEVDQWRCIVQQRLTHSDLSLEQAHELATMISNEHKRKDFLRWLDKIADYQSSF